MTITPTLCSSCGQPMLLRQGVKFPPKKAAILDMIESVSKGRGGIELDTLAWVFYPGVSLKAARDRIRNHICQINDLLVSTSYKIVNENGMYKWSKQNANSHNRSQLRRNERAAHRPPD